MMAGSEPLFGIPLTIHSRSCERELFQGELNWNGSSRWNIVGKKGFHAQSLDLRPYFSREIEPRKRRIGMMVQELPKIWSTSGGRHIQNMDPRSMDHPCGPGPWTPSWTLVQLDYPCGQLIIL